VVSQKEKKKKALPGWAAEEKRRESGQRRTRHDLVVNLKRKPRP